MPAPLVPAPGLWLQGHPRSGHIQSLGLSPSLLSAVCAGRGIAEETELWGHWHHRGLLEGLVGTVEGTQAFQTIRSCMGAHLHVKGGWYSIYFNKHLRCARDLCLLCREAGLGQEAALGPDCGGLTRLSAAGAALSGVLKVWSARVRACGSLPPTPPTQESSRATVSFNLLFTVDVTVIATATGGAHNFNPRVLRGRGGFSGL